MRILFLALALWCTAAHASVTTMSNAAITTGAQPSVTMACPSSNGACARTFACNETVTSGSGTATVLIQGSLDPAHAFWVTISTLSTITDLVTAAATDTSKYAVYRANVSAITGTGAKVYCYGGM